MNKINWKLEKTFKESIFENISIKEYTNLKKVKGFIQNNLGINYDNKIKYEELFKKFKNENEQMKKYLKKYSIDEKVFKVKLFLPKHKYGRIIYEDHTSLAIFRRLTRHSYCNDIYIDIDIVNSMPSIIYEICKINNYDIQKIKNLEYYVKHRNDFINEIKEYYGTTFDKVKNLFIIIMMGGKYESWVKEEDIDVMNKEIPDKIKYIDEEFSQLRELVYSHNEEIKNIKLDKWTNNNKEKRGVFSIWYQTIERNIQETLIKFLIREKNVQLNEVIPCQDGFMILKNYYYDNLLKDCEDEIKNLYSIQIKLKLKDFDEKIDIKDYEGELLENFNFLKTTTDFLDYIYECNEFKNKIFKQDEKIYYCYNEYNKIFEDVSVQDIRHKISKYILNLLRENEYLLDEKTFHKYESKYGNEMSKILKDFKVNNNIYTIFNKLQCFIPIKDNKVIYIGEKNCKIFNNDVIYHDNEIYDKIDGFIYTKNIIVERNENFKFNYISNVNFIDILNEKEKYFSEKYFNDIFCNNDNTVKSVLDILKTCIAGIQLKYLFCCLGAAGNNGKTIFFNDMFKGIMGRTMDVLNKSLIIETKIKSNINTEFEKLDKIKVGYVSEFKNTDTFTNDIIKTLTGGDPVTLRTLQTKETTIKPTCNIFINSNELPASAYSLDIPLFNRIIIIPFNNIFEKNANFKCDIYNNLDALFSYIIYRGNIIEDNLILSDEMISAKDNYKLNNKTESFLSDFLEESIEDFIGNKIIREDLYNAYYDWCFAKNLKFNKKSYGNFSKDLNKDHGIKNFKSNNINYYLDIKFK
jgi:hypothetical protein